MDPGKSQKNMGDRPRAALGTVREIPFGAGLAAAAVLFCLLGVLGAQTDWWWVDESYTWNLIQTDMATIPARTAVDVHPPFYYVCLKLWHGVLPQPRGMKLFSLAAGLGAVLLIGWVGRMLAGRRAGIYAALLWATCPMVLHYSQEARMYALGLMLETLALAGWALGPRRPLAGWVLLVAGLTGSIYTQNLCLVFAAALVGGEVARWVFARRFRGRPARFASDSPRSDLSWIVWAGAIAGGLYLPWFFVLLRQVRSHKIAPFFHDPSWREIAEKLFHYPFAIHFDRPEKWLAWALGVGLLGVVPLAWAAGEAWRGRLLAGRRPAVMVLWAGAGPFIFLVLYSKYFNPMFEISRHGVLFIPFLLFPAALVMGAEGARGPRRAASLGVIGLMGALAVTELGSSRDWDARPHRDALMERAPAGLPIVFYPPVVDYSRLLWSPLPVLVQGIDNRAIERLTSCTLVLHHTYFTREAVRSQARRTMARAAGVREIYTTFEVSAYVLTGLPPGAIAELESRPPAQTAMDPEGLAGRWAPGTRWEGAGLADHLQPRGEVVSFSPEYPEWLGTRLGAKRSSIAMPEGAPGDATFAAVMAAGNHVAAGGTTETLRYGVAGGDMEALELRGGDFLAARIVPLPVAGLTMNFEISEGLARRPFAPSGDVPPGVYLTWAGLRALRPEDFRQPGFDGIWLDVGGLGDSVFLRKGFNEAEGAPPAEVRWTMGEFALEAPVWSGRPVGEVVLMGLLPAQVRQRRIGLRATQSGTGKAIEAWAEPAGAAYGEVAFKLPEALGAGVWRLEFRCGTWSPKEAGLGEDPRRLGFYLNAVGLR